MPKLLAYIKHRNCRISVENVVKTSNDFMATMYRSIRYSSDDNFIMSAFSLRTVLFVIFDGARNENKNEVCSWQIACYSFQGAHGINVINYKPL